MKQTRPGHNRPLVLTTQNLSQRDPILVDTETKYVLRFFLTGLCVQLHELQHSHGEADDKDLFYQDGQRAYNIKLR